MPKGEALAALRRLSTDQQVGLLFLVLFCMLVLLSLVILAIPVAGALAGAPERLLERNAKIQWGIMFCVYGLRHAPALVGAALFWITPTGLWQAATMALVAAGCGSLGEPVMRALKKDAGVRYWGNRSCVTGAVRLPDRVAPLCFAAPVFFHFVRWYLV
jgi:predicted CDP-diglyceride synthetase/phosphatidate cytidylyltransferase